MKDISALTMDTNFAKHIGQTPTKSEFLIPANSRVSVTKNTDKCIYLRSVK